MAPSGKFLKTSKWLVFFQFFAKFVACFQFLLINLQFTQHVHWFNNGNLFQEWRFPLTALIDKQELKNEDRSIHADRHDSADSVCQNLKDNILENDKIMK